MHHLFTMRKAGVVRRPFHGQNLVHLYVKRGQLSRCIYNHAGRQNQRQEAGEAGYFFIVESMDEMGWVFYIAYKAPSGFTETIGRLKKLSNPTSAYVFSPVSG